jgi:ACR3 family arsenite transporter
MRAPSPRKRLSSFERYLTLWVAACMVVGVAIGKLAPRAVGALRDLEFGDASHINVPIAIVIWLMIYPLMLKIDFVSLLGVRKRPGGLLITLFVNWVVKPFSMALPGWVFFKHLFLPWIGAELADQHVAGVITWPRRPAPPWSSSGRTSPTETLPTRSSRSRSTI